MNFAALVCCSQGGKFVAVAFHQHHDFLPPIGGTDSECAVLPFPGVINRGSCAYQLF